MSVKEFVLSPTQNPPIVFQGRVVAHAIGPADDPALLGRHHEIAVYETDKGELHLSIAFISTCDCATAHRNVELGVQPDEIAEILLLYDASEYVNRKLLRHRHESVTRKFMKRLYGQYDQLCAEIEQQMREYEPVSLPAMGDETMKEGNGDAQSGWRTWISFRKPR